MSTSLALGKKRCLNLVPNSSNDVNTVDLIQIRPKHSLTKESKEYCLTCSKSRRERKVDMIDYNLHIYFCLRRLDISTSTYNLDLNGYPGMLNALEKYVKSKEMLESKCIDIQISGLSLKCLFNTNQLNDEVIDFYLSNLFHLSHKFCYLKTYFYRQLHKFKDFKSADKTNEHSKLYKHYIQEQHRINQILVVPINCKDHWILAFVNLDELKIVYYNSFKKYNELILSEVHDDILDFFLKAYYKKTCIISLSQSFNYEIENLPKQTNLQDCGVFICRYAYCKLKNLKADFKQKHSNLIRLDILLYILNCIKQHWLEVSN